MEVDTDGWEDLGEEGRDYNFGEGDDEQVIIQRLREDVACEGRRK
jgi:hypothetical protein